MPADGGPNWRTVVLTGATSGIGLATAQALSGRADRLILQGPEPADAITPLLSRLRDSGPAQIDYVSCDFTRLADVAEAAETIRRFGPLDALINDAGVPGSDRRQMTADGHERTLQVNFLAMVLLTQRLAPALPVGSRIVNLASATHEMASLDLADLELEDGYSAVRAYARSKLAIILFTRWLARHHEVDATAVSLQPGVIDTRLLSAMFGSIGSPVERGARSILAALSADARGGEYYDEERLATPSAEARDDHLGDALMEWTLRALEPFLRRGAA